MKVCHFISGLDPVNGGTAVAMAGMAPAQVRAGLDVTVAATWVDRAPVEQARKLEAAGVKVRLLGPCRDPMSRHPDLAPWVGDRVGGCDVAHVHALFEAIQYQATRAAQGRGVPYVITPHGMLDPWRMRQGRWKKRLYLALRLRRMLDRAAAVHYTAEIERELVTPLRITSPGIVVPNGVDLGEFKELPASGTLRAKWPELEGKKVVMFFGRVHPMKGLDLLIPAFARADVKDAMLVMVGPVAEGYGPVVEKLIEANGVRERVVMAGPVYGAERVAALADADLFVLASYSENFGIAVVEALAAGRPVVISDQVNIHNEIARAGVGGVVPTDVERLTKELRRWLGDENLRREAGGKARAFVWETYDWDKIAREWAEQYGRIAVQARGSAAGVA